MNAWEVSLQVKSLCPGCGTCATILLKPQSTEDHFFLRMQNSSSIYRYLPPLTETVLLVLWYRRTKRTVPLLVFPSLRFDNLRIRHDRNKPRHHLLVKIMVHFILQQKPSGELWTLQTINRNLFRAVIKFGRIKTYRVCHGS